MTDHCLDTDSLVNVASALEWAVPARLDHLAACERCRARLAELASLQSQLVAPVALAELGPATATAVATIGMMPLTPSTTAEIAPAATSPGGMRPRPAAPLVTAATFLTAGATALLVVTLLAGSPPAPVALTFAGLAGLSAIAPGRWLRRA